MSARTPKNAEPFHASSSWVSHPPAVMKRSPSAWKTGHAFWTTKKTSSVTISPEKIAAAPSR